MRNSNKKIKLFIMLKYSHMLAIMMTIVMTILTLLPFLPFQIFPPASRIFNFIWIIVGSVLSAICLITGIVSYQTAILSEKGIILKIAIWKIAEIDWKEIIKVDVKSLVTLYSHLKCISKNWIILYTQDGQEAKEGGGNRKNHPPWQIIYNKKNAETIKDFLKKYTSIVSKID